MAEGPEADAQRRIGRRIQEARRKAGFNSAEDFHKETKIPLSTLQKIERGAVSVSLPKLRYINGFVGNLDINFYFRDDLSYEDSRFIPSVSERIEKMQSELSEKIDASKRESGFSPETFDLLQSLESSPQLSAIVQRLSGLSEHELARASDVVTTTLISLGIGSGNPNQISPLANGTEG